MPEWTPSSNIINMLPNKSNAKAIVTNESKSTDVSSQGSVVSIEIVQQKVINNPEDAHAAKVLN